MIIVGSIEVPTSRNRVEICTINFEVLVVVESWCRLYWENGRFLWGMCRL